MHKNPFKTNSYILFLAGFSCAAQAQIAPDAGSILREQTQPRLEIPTRPAPEIKFNEPVRPALKPNAARFVLKSFRTSGNSAFAQGELLVLLQDYVGKEIGYADLDAAAARISRYYRDRGYMVARAYLPAQDIVDGNVEIAVLEGRYGKADLNNRSRVRDSVARGYIDGFPGAAVYAPNLERKVLLLSDLAGVDEARAALRPGAAVGESDITFELTPAPLVTGNVELDNHGNRYTGANRLSGQLNLLSPLGLGDQFSARLTKGFDGLEYGRLNYLLPLGGDGFKLGGAYSATRYKLGGAFAPLNASGDSDTYTLSVSYPFIRSRSFNLYGQIAYDWRDFEDRIASTATVIDKKTRAANFTLSGDARDGFAGGGVNVYSLTYASGHVDIQSPVQLAIDSATARSNGNFDKWNLNLIRLQSLTQNTSLFLSFAGQKAGKNLDSSEKFILGGAQGVRAYPAGEGVGDSGNIATAELRYSFTSSLLPGILQPFAFVDAGAVTISENPFAAGVNRRHLAGGGVGLLWAKANDFQVKLTVATRIGAQPVVSDANHHTRGWVQLIKYF